MSKFAAKQSANGKRIKWQVGLETDIGGCRENQDDCFAWIKKDENLVVICVLDGHGREVGRIASETAKKCLFKHLDDNYPALQSDPVNFLIEAHGIAHNHIRDAFQQHLQKQGYQVKRTGEDGYLLKRKPPAEYWSCVHGGTSCSMVALVNGTLYIANVGDSTGILCTVNAVLKKEHLQYITDASIGEKFSDSKEQEEVDHTEQRMVPGDNNINPDKLTNTLIMTAEHSPESPYEYMRMRYYRQREGDPQQPALLVVYDSSSHDKSKCSTVFDRTNNGPLQPSNRGSYYKNVRKEWASLVSTPSYAQFQDALAFTRSLGDLHLHTYGVSHSPEVQSIDMNILFDEVERSGSNPSSQDHVGEGTDGSTRRGSAIVDEISSGIICVVLATDGVWDNWLYEDINKFVLDSSCLGAVATGVDGARRVTISLMQRNALYAKRNFGSHADNATGIVLYLSRSDIFPSD